MSSQLTISQQIEAILLYQGGALKVSALAKTLEKPVDAIEQGITDLEGELSERGVSLVREGDKVALTTSSLAFPVIEKLRRDELEGAVGKAGLETLAVIMYRGPISRSDIEYIRGVNVSSMLRSLLIRGLIERVDNPSDKRSFLYKPTTELTAYLGVTRLSDIQGYAEVKKELDAVIEAKATSEEPL